MEGYVWIIIIVVLLIIVLPIVGIILLISGVKNMSKDGFCYRTDSSFGGEVCSLMTKDKCEQNKGKHFDTMDECDNYMGKNMKESYDCGCCN